MSALAAVSLLLQLPAAQFSCPDDAVRKVERRADATLVYCEGPDLMGGQAKNGPYRELRPDRTLRWAGSYVNDRPDGTWLRFDRNKQVVERRVYNLGRLLSRTLEDEEMIQGEGAAGPALDGDEDLSEFEGPEAEEAPDGPGVGPRGAFDEEKIQRGPETRAQFSEGDFAPQHYGFANSVGPLVQGDSVFGVGATVLFFVPTLDLRYRYGVADPLAFDVRMSSLGIYSRLHLGFRSRLVGDEKFSLFLDTHLGSNAFFIPGGSTFVSAQGFELAGVPGLGFSFGSPDVQFTFGSQVPIYFLTVFTSDFGDGVATGAIPRVRPFFGLDVVVGDKTSLYTTLEVETDLNTDPEPESISADTLLFFWSIGVAFDFNRRSRIY